MCFGKRNQKIGRFGNGREGVQTSKDSRAGVFGGKWILHDSQAILQYVQNQVEGHKT